LRGKNKQYKIKSRRENSSAPSYLKGSYKQLNLNI
jgi:hypothetical protein